MKQQLIVSGLGGQGVLFLTRVIAEAAVQTALPVLTAETHGMAQRGGSVLSTIKIGDFHSPLVRSGQAEIGLFLYAANLAIHRPLVRADGTLVINRTEAGEGIGIDAAGLARQAGNPLLANLILLGRAVREKVLFCSAGEIEGAIRALSPARFVEQNLAAFRLGMRE